MNRTKMIVEMLVILLAAAVRSTRQNQATPEDGFVPLFDGKTLKGWTTTGNWIVEKGGVVALHPRPGNSGW